MDSDPGAGLTLLVLGAAYLLGSIPFGLLLANLGGLGDIRQIGSGNIGATNVLRTGHKGIALLTLLCDIAKGIVPVLIVRLLWPDALLLAAGASLFAVLGHLFPVWLRFKGGKGVATMFGALVTFSWPVGTISAIVWLLLAALFRYSSLASLLAVALTPFTTWYYVGPGPAWAVAIIAILVIALHHANIRRLMRGEESKITFRKPDPAS
ncbi:MAG: glycerol-3-phosphate 1-O-acyltransferase PlsY [Alphaproteobacteria bacterium]|nr:glycerol-3-phosphate 1-O-acyltransferase PlsY [Alphaproteobacteria bacterium]